MMLREFLEARTGAGGSVPDYILYGAYLVWVRKQGYIPGDREEFVRALEEMGYKLEGTPPRWMGLHIKS